MSTSHGDPAAPQAAPVASTPVPPVSVESSNVVATVFDAMLAAIDTGELEPGDLLSDGKIAEKFGISRTPVREALQRLREIGVVEASANRFTRVAMVSPRQTADAMQVWLALYALVIEETVPTATPAVLDAMRIHHENCVGAASEEDLHGIASANFNFFAELAATSHNPTLLRAITSVVHVVRLGSLHLAERLDFAQILAAQAMLLSAVGTHDIDTARRALRMLHSVRIPLEDPAA